MDIKRFKYSRTFNLPWSESNSSDDVWLKNCKQFDGKQVVVTEKMDGECTTIYHDGKTHARSVDSKHHPSRSWIKQFAATFSHEIPSGWRICGENLFACHSIFYTELPSYFLVFGIYDDQNRCLSWPETEETCEFLKLHTVPVLYKGIWDQKLVTSLWTGRGFYPTFESKKDDPKFPEDFEPCVAEGYVVRAERWFDYDDFAKYCGKYVRKNHVTTDSHWMERIPIPNLLRAT